MALLFHGTTEDNLEQILRLGLQPPPSDPERGVFLSTAPVAGKGGDPVAFAFGWPDREFRNPRRLPGHLVVVDLPPHEIRLDRDVVTNTDFDIAWNARRIRRELVNGYASQVSPWCLLYWFADCLNRQRIPLEPHPVATTLRTNVSWRDPALRDDLTPDQWTRFLDDYLHLMDVRRRDYSGEQALRRERRKILAAHDISLPDWIEDDPDSRSCAHCLGTAFQYSYELTGLADHQPFKDFLEALAARLGPAQCPDEWPTPQLPTSPPNRPLLDNLAYVLRVVEAHTQPYDKGQIERFFLEHEYSTRWTWQDWYKAFPRQAAGLPRAWTVDYDRPAPITPDALRRPDSQVLATHIPAHLIVGTIQVTDGRRLVPDLRPNRSRGETLPSLLWRKAHELRRSGL